MATFIKILLRAIFFCLVILLISKNVLSNIFHGSSVYTVLIAFFVTWLIDPFTDLLTAAIVTGFNRPRNA